MKDKSKDSKSSNEGEDGEDSGESEEDETLEIELKSDVEDDSTSSGRSYPISGHLKPSKVLKTREEMILASISAVRQINDASLAKDRNAACVERKEFIDRPRESANYLLKYSTKTFQLALDAVLSGDFASNFTYEKFCSIKGEDAIDDQDAGCYLFIGWDPKTKPLFVYIGRAESFEMRVPLHFFHMDTSFEHGQSKNLLVRLGKEAKKKGAELFCRVLFRLPKGGILNDDKQVLLLVEPALQYFFGSNQKNSNDLKLRSKLGLPMIPVRGANSTRCFDGFQTPSTSTFGNSSLQKLAASILNIRLQYAFRRACQYCESTSAESREVARKETNRLEKIFLELQSKYRQQAVKEIRAGTFLVRFAFRDSKPIWQATNFFTNNCNPATLKKVVGEEASSRKHD